MKVLYALICEDATMRPDGRIDVHGIFHQLFAPGFPAQQDRLVVAVALEWDASEIGRIAFRIDLLDPSRSPALTINGHTDVAERTGEDPVPLQTRIVMPLVDVIFPTAGTYEFELHVRGERVRLTPLYLVEDRDAR